MLGAGRGRECTSLLVGKDARAASTFATEKALSPEDLAAKIKLTTRDTIEGEHNEEEMGIVVGTSAR